MVDNDLEAEISTFIQEGGQYVRRHSRSETKKMFFGKIYIAVITQYGCFILVCVATLYVDWVQQFFTDHGWISFVFMALFFAMLVLLSVWSSLRRRYPLNLGLLTVLTVLNSLWLASIVAEYNLKIILYSLSANAGIATIISIFAVLSPYDVNARPMILLLILAIIIVLSSTFGVIKVFVKELQYFALAMVASIAASVYYFLVTTLVVKSGDVDDTEWVLAVLIIYTAVPHMIVYMIHTIGGISPS
ncbi:protein lifeguard 1-like [Cimex lectularius]|uniref:Uncharacterized protein n=1 Tax=Cimex lectularius TaxID=79782 RepID=A0A8I6RV54_CIMLE|nr:protein lifeguard 1-like [Cimex lectularius]